MTFGVNEFVVCHATIDDLDAIKQIADAHRRELGFVRRPTLLAAINRQEIFVAKRNEQIIGFVEYHHRRDNQTTLYNIVVKADYRTQGVGRALVEALAIESRGRGKAFILLKCPIDLPSNQFYKTLQFQSGTAEAGKHRPLNIWQLDLSPK